MSTSQRKRGLRTSLIILSGLFVGLFLLWETTGFSLNPNADAPLTAGEVGAVVLDKLVDALWRFILPS